ncbi:hypothetical protein AMECASPLE_035067, partial [Ameca splendens]
QPHTSTGQQFVPAKEQWADEQTETQICKQEENLTKEQPKMFAKEILSDKLEEPTNHISNCFMKIRRERVAENVVGSGCSSLKQSLGAEQMQAKYKFIGCLAVLVVKTGRTRGNLQPPNT